MRHILATVLALSLLLLCLPMTVGAAAPGDLNGDNTVNDRDAIYLLYHTVLPEEYPLYVAADYNGDNTTDDSDALYLLYHSLLPADYAIDGSVPTTVPAAGYDPDGKGRVQLIAASAEENVATVTFQNISNRYTVDENSYVTYTCTAANGTVLKTGNLALGYMDCTQDVTQTIILPEGAVALNFTGSVIEYWGKWIM